MLSAPILAASKVTKSMMGSAAEAEVAATHVSAKEAASARQCLEEVGHPQPAARVRAGNAAAQEFANGATKKKRSRTFGRQLWWLKGREQQLQLHAAWGAGACSLAGYPAKRRASQRCKAARPACLRAGGKPPRSLCGRGAALGARKPAKKALLAVMRLKGLLAAAVA